MNRTHLLNYVLNPASISPGASAELLELTRLYPYFQGGHIMLSRALKTENDIRFFDSLKMAAAQSGNRAYLDSFMNGLVVEQKRTVVAEEEKPTQTTFPPQTVLAKQDLLPDNFQLPVHTEQEVIDQILAYPEIDKSVDIPTVQSSQLSAAITYLPAPEDDAEEKHSFFEWLMVLTPPPVSEMNTAEMDPSQEPSLMSPVSPKSIHAEIIEKFIRTEPRISKPEKKEFFSPVSMAKKSVEDNNEIVTETLARIYAEQGNTEKAVRIYRILALQDPGKSSYFDALIEKLENPS